MTTSDDSDDKWQFCFEEAGSRLSPPPQKIYLKSDDQRRPNVNKVTTKTVQAFNSCLLCAAGVMEVVAGIIDQCGSESDTKWQGEHEKRDHNPKVATVTTSDDK